MTAKEKTLNKICCFYASDFHLEMTLLPYINKKFNENKKVIIVTQNNLEESIKILISRMQIKDKEKILNINWNNNKIDENGDYKDSVIIVNGTEEFIKEIDDKIIEKNSFYEIIDCYLFDEIKDKIDIIRDSYTRVLNNLQKNY